VNTRRRLELSLDNAGNVVVTNPAGNVIPSLVALRGAAGDIERRNRAAGIAVDATPRRLAGTAIRSTSVTSPLPCGVPTNARTIGTDQVSFRTPM
jgi:hypothetical protein